MYFLTVWLKNEDTEEQREQYNSTVVELVKKFCNIELYQTKISPSGKRITVTLPCDSQEFKCTKDRNTISNLINEIEDKINRVSKAKAHCKGD